MVEIHYEYCGKPRRVYAKYESMNMTGSVKDRMAAHILRRAYESGELSPGDAIVEASSGNTGGNVTQGQWRWPYKIEPGGAQPADEV